MSRLPRGYGLVCGAPLILLLACSQESREARVLHLAPDGVVEEPLVVRSVSRMGFRSAAGRTHRVRFEVPPRGATLWLSGAVVSQRSVSAPGRISLVAAVARPGQEPTPVFRQRARPDRWVEATVDLAPYAGEPLTLELSSELPDQTAVPEVLWGTPAVFPETTSETGILMICIDSLRADHVHCYGYPRRTSPTLDSLASEGCMFARAIAQSPWTLPSHASLFTSLYLSSHGVGDARSALSPDARTVQEVLRDAGYFTGAIISGGPILPDQGLNQGFDVYDASCCTGSATDSRNRCTHDRAAEWIERFGRAPFFLFVHYWDVHLDYVPPAPYDTLFDPGYDGVIDGKGIVGNRHIHTGMPQSDLNHLVALYDGEVAHTDTYVRRLLDTLTGANLQQRTVVVVTADHGDEFLEHGGTAHGHSLFQELIHVPLIWVAPRGGPRGCVIEDAVQLVDLAPTILEFVGLETPPEMQGRSLVALMLGAAEHAQPVFSEARSRKGLNAVLLGDTKLVATIATGEMAIYDLATDPMEQSAVAPDRAPRGAEVRDALEKFFTLPEHEIVTLEVEAKGTGPKGRFAATVTSGWIVSVQPSDLEESDSVYVDPHGRKVVIVPDCTGDDVDGVAVRLFSRNVLVALHATMEGQPLSQDRVLLGSGRPLKTPLPAKMEAGDQRLLLAGRGAPPPLPAGPVVRFWVRTQSRELAIPAQLDEEATRQLRALGYLQ